MTVCPICENAHSDECSPSALKARIDREAAETERLRGILASVAPCDACDGHGYTGDHYMIHDADGNAQEVDERGPCQTCCGTGLDGAPVVAERDALRGEIAALSTACNDLAARLAEAEVELLDLRSGKDRLIEALGATGEDRRWKWLIAAVWDLRRDLAEALATLANERGEGEPPVEGWTARPRGDLVRWVRFSARPGRTLDVVRQASDEPGVVRCHWWDREIDKDGDVTATYAEGYAPTFRAAMRAASERLRGTP